MYEHFFVKRWNEEKDKASTEKSHIVVSTGTTPKGSQEPKPNQASKHLNQLTSKVQSHLLLQAMQLHKRTWSLTTPQAPYRVNTQNQSTTVATIAELENTRQALQQQRQHLGIVSINVLHTRQLKYLKDAEEDYEFDSHSTRQWNWTGNYSLNA